MFGFYTALISIHTHTHTDKFTVTTGWGVLFLAESLGREGAKKAATG